MRPKSAKGGQDGPPKVRPGRPGEARRGLKGQAGEALKTKAFSGHVFEAKGRAGRNAAMEFGGEGFTPLLRMGLLGKPIRAFNCHVVFSLVASCLPWRGASNGKGRRREAKEPPRVAKGSEKASKTTLRTTNWRPKWCRNGVLRRPLAPPWLPSASLGMPLASPWPPLVSLRST